MSSSDGHWSYYEYADDDSLTKRWRADTGAGTYFEYDKTGSCEKIVSPAGVTYFEYTHANLVSRMVELGGSDFEFGYDGSGTRYAIVEDGVSTYYLWDDLRLMETRNADYTLKARFAHGPARVEGIGTCVEIYVPSSSKRYYMLYDHRGSAHVVMDEGKSVVATRLYNAFGEIISQTGSWPDEVPFGYQTNWLAPPGLTLPDGTQLYLSSRVFVPPDGRFLQRDFRRAPGENAYVYAANNPVNMVDPTGMYSIAELGEMCEGDLAQALKEMSPLELFRALRWSTDRLVRDRGGIDSEGYKKRLGLLEAVEAELNNKTGTTTFVAARLKNNQTLGKRGRRYVRQLLKGAIRGERNERTKDLARRGHRIRGMRRGSERRREWQKWLRDKETLDRELGSESRVEAIKTETYLSIWKSPVAIETITSAEEEYLKWLDMRKKLIQEIIEGAGPDEVREYLEVLAKDVSTGSSVLGFGLGIAESKRFVDLFAKLGWKPGRITKFLQQSKGMKFLGKATAVAGILTEGYAASAKAYGLLAGKEEYEDIAGVEVTESVFWTAAGVLGLAFPPSAPFVAGGAILQTAGKWGIGRLEDEPGHTQKAQQRMFAQASQKMSELEVLLYPIVER